MKDERLESGRVRRRDQDGSRAPGRVFHITTHKSGSQWVRDVLTAPELLKGSGLRHVPHPADLTSQNVWPGLPSGAFCSPVYWINGLEWKALHEAGDRAVVVIRDPRDCIVSMMYSWLYSHANTPFVEILRDTLFASESTEVRLARVYVYGGRLWQRFFSSWVELASDDVLVVRYEDLIANQDAAFGRILTWLGWKWEQDSLSSVVDRFSFERRSGRRPGDTDPMSHYRRGVAGDWRAHFTASLGSLWETIAPGLMTATGYEVSDDWWQTLPDRLDANTEPDRSPEEERIEAQGHRIHVLERELRGKEDVIRELATACEERLGLIQELDKALKAGKMHEGSL